jgi:undecaprenyl-diphosphatase
MYPRVALAFQRFDRAELGVCRYLNRSSRLRLVRALFRAVSWLGNGWFWYAIAIILPLRYGAAGGTAAVQMVCTGTVGLALYKLIKRRAVRERPFITHPAIDCAVAPLDR